MEWLQGAPKDKDYRFCHKFATITIVGENSHYVLGVCPLGSEEYAENDMYPGKPQTYYHGNVVRRLLAIADEYANIQTVFADRAFHAVDVIHAIEHRNLKYVIPAKLATVSLSCVSGSTVGRKGTTNGTVKTD